MPSEAEETCLSCGARLEPNAKICAVCGTEVSHDEFLSAAENPPSAQTPKGGRSLSALQKYMAAALLAVGVIGAASFGISRSTMPDIQQAPPADHGQEQGGMSESDFKKQQEEMMAQSHSLLQNVKDSLKAEPDNPRLILKLANLYYDIKQFDEAEPYYRRYLTDFDQKNANARVDYGYVLFSIGKRTEGVSELRKVLKDEPNHAFALFNLGIMHYEMKDMQAARQWFEKCAANATEDRLKTMAQQILRELDAQKSL